MMRYGCSIMNQTYTLRVMLFAYYILVGIFGCVTCMFSSVHFLFNPFYPF